MSHFWTKNSSLKNEKDGLNPAYSQRCSTNGLANIHISGSETNSRHKINCKIKHLESIYLIPSNITYRIYIHIKYILFI